MRVGMSVHVYTGPHAARRSRSTTFAALPGILAVATIVSQILWPLASGHGRAVLTIITVVLFASTCAVHALVHHGLAWTSAWLVASLGFGWAVEALGTHTGYPFGTYAYSDQLGWRLNLVPIVIPLAWAMMSYPALAVARRLTHGRWTTPLIAALAFASWDLFLDPQMVGEGYWTWTTTSPYLPGIPGIPVVNYLGWLLAACILMLVLDRLPRSRPGTDVVPGILYVWTWLGGVIANAVWLDHRGSAAWGGVVMGAIAVPYAWVAWTGRP
jgi:putative membrane protein